MIGCMLAYRTLHCWLWASAWQPHTVQAMYSGRWGLLSIELIGIELIGIELIGIELIGIELIGIAGLTSTAASHAVPDSHGSGHRLCSKLFHAAFPMERISNGDAACPPDDDCPSGYWRWG